MPKINFKLITVHQGFLKPIENWCVEKKTEVSCFSCFSIHDITCLREKTRESVMAIITCIYCYNLCRRGLKPQLWQLKLVMSDLSWPWQVTRRVSGTIPFIDMLSASHFYHPIFGFALPNLPLKRHKRNNPEICTNLWWLPHLGQPSSGWWLSPTPLKMMDFVSWDDDIPTWVEKKHVPNHQPVINQQNLVMRDSPHSINSPQFRWEIFRIRLIGGTYHIFLAYFSGLNFSEYHHNSYGPKYGTFTYLHVLDPEIPIDVTK